MGEIPTRQLVGAAHPRYHHAWGLDAELQASPAEMAETVNVSKSQISRDFIEASGKDLKSYLDSPPESEGVAQERKIG